MKGDIENRRDLVDLLESFYQKAFRDDLIGHFFTEVIPLQLDVHIPVIADFWESVLFQTRGYRKNVMQVHEDIHSISRIEKAHLDRWLTLFCTTIDEMFEGEKALLMKQRARSIATLMDIKLNHKQIGKK
jgi:hemoglobin